LPLGGIKICLKRRVLRWRRKELTASEERSKSGREFQIVKAAEPKEREPKIRLAGGTCERFEEKDDLTFTFTKI